MRQFGKHEGEKKMTFGKYKGLSYDDLWEKDKKYVAYMLQFRGTDNEKFYKRPIDYFTEKIEREFVIEE
jgi:hypothetical protein